VILALLACTNRPPYVVSVNGSKYDRDVFGDIAGYSSFGVAPGEVVPIEIVYKDPDGDPVQVFFSDMPGMVTFDPSGTTGILEVFEGSLADTGDWREPEGRITVIDDHDPPGWSEVPFPYHLSAEVDTGG
jgi:hypothetical protein